MMEGGSFEITPEFADLAWKGLLALVLELTGTQMHNRSRGWFLSSSFYFLPWDMDAGCGHVHRVRDLCGFP
jgi:hypothetical protein